jgi:ferric-dicitrate binding protein FerR (iron transport regulator)
MSAIDGLLELVDGYLAGTLTEVQQADLDRRLCTEPRSRQLFWLAINHEVLLRTRTVAGLEGVAAADAGPGGAPWWRAMAVRWAAAALILVLLGAAARFGLRQGAGPGILGVASLVPARAGGGGSVHHPDHRQEPLRIGQVLGQDDAIEVEDGASVELRAPGEATTFALEGAASLVVRTTPQGMRLRLEHGELTAEVAHQPPGRQVMIGTPQATVEVVGTRFVVAASAERTSVDVDDGRVRVAASGIPGDRAEIGPGGRVVARTGQRLDESPLSELSWSDHRPIGVLMLCTGESGWPRNPRGWLHDAAIDITTAGGREELRRRLEAIVDQSIANLHAVGAQALVFWDLEGMESPLGYVGDPRQLATLAPEMDAIADGLIERVRSAGIAVGVAIRLDEVIRARPGGALSLSPAHAPALLAQQRMHYAHKRWGATIFPLLGAPREGMDIATICRRLHADSPQALIIPTAAHGEADRWSAPWIQPEQLASHLGSPHRPGSMAVIAPLDDAYMAAHRDELIHAVEAGDVLTLRAWYKTDGHLLVQQIQAAAQAHPR